MEKIIIIEVSDNKSVYIKASSIEAIEVNKVEVNELKYVICVNTSNGKEFNSRVYENCVEVQSKVDEILKFMLDCEIKDKSIYVLD